MDALKHRIHLGKLEELVRQHRAFEKFKGTAGHGTWHEWKSLKTNKSSFEKLIIFIGKTGYGKSTTINAIAGHDYMKTSDVSACTRTCQCLDYQIQNDHWLSLGDLPGVGENGFRDKEYLAMYESMLPYASVIVHVLRADSRDYSIDEHLTQKLFRRPSIRRRIIYALGQCDKIEPIERATFTKPSAQQARNISRKKTSVEKIFSPENRVIPYSALSGWNLDALTTEIIHVAMTTDRKLEKSGSLISGFLHRDKSP